MRMYSASAVTGAAGGLDRGGNRMHRAEAADETGLGGVGVQEPPTHGSDRCDKQRQPTGTSQLSPVKQQ